jgi:uncharacterized DUF497 family protein
MTPEFEWDPDKNRSNQRKHGVSFEDAATVFLDENADSKRDPDDWGEEDRFILIGLSSKHRILIVCHCYRESDARIRIISARKASPIERLDYENRL